MLKEGDMEPVTAEDIIEYCKKNMSTYQVPRSVELIKTLPKSAVGKVLRRELRKLSKRNLRNLAVAERPWPSRKATRSFLLEAAS